MICAIHQPQFIPWLGYLHKVQSADVFVLLDNVQFKKNEFQNRNKILMNGEGRWLTAPVQFQFGDCLNEVKLPADSAWSRKLQATLDHAYGKAPHYRELGEGLKQILQRSWPNLAELNKATLEWLMACLGITTPLLVCSQLPAFNTERTQRLVEICRHAGADTYLSGLGARDYLDLDAFERAGLQVVFQHFEHPAYPQGAPGHGAFVSHLSAIDGLFWCGGGEKGRQALNLNARRMTP